MKNMKNMKKLLLGLTLIIGLGLTSCGPSAKEQYDQLTRDAEARDAALKTARNAQDAQMDNELKMAKAYGVSVDELRKILNKK